MENKDVNAKLADILRGLADVAEGKLSLSECVERYVSNNKEAETMRRFYETFTSFVRALKVNVKEEYKTADRQNEFNAQYDESAKVVLPNGSEGILVKPKEKLSWLQRFRKNAARDLKTLGAVVGGEKTVKQALKETSASVHEGIKREIKPYRKFSSVVEGTVRGVGKTFNHLRGIGNNQSVRASDKSRSPYANMNNENFAVVLGTCLENVVRCENMGFESQVKREALEEFDAVIKEAQKRFPDVKPAQVGEYFKDKDYAQAEARLFAYAKEAYKNDPALGLEIKKHESWRDNKDFELGMLKERPFHNTSVYASRNYPQGEKEGDTFAAYCKSTKYMGRKIDVAAERRLIAGKVR